MHLYATVIFNNKKPSCC